MDKELVKKTAIALGEENSMATRIIDHYEEFIASTIKSGRLQNVRVPVFGTFQVNMKKIKYHTQVQPMPETKVVRRKKQAP